MGYNIKSNQDFVKSELILTMEKIEKKVEKIGRRQAKEKGENIVAFRGEAKDYGDTALTPTWFRDGYHSEHKLLELMEDYNITNENNLTTLKKLVDAQHYLEISRLLDITFNSLIALYFCCQYHQKEDGILYVFCFPQRFSPSVKYMDEIIEDIIYNSNTFFTMNTNFKIINHSLANERIKLQKGGFVLFPGEEGTTIPDIYYEKITIKAECKKSILRDLQLYFGIEESSVFPEKEHKKDLVRKNLKSTPQNQTKSNVDIEVQQYIENLIYVLELLGDNEFSEKEIIDKKRRVRKNFHDLLFEVENYFSKVENSDKLREKELLVDKINFKFEEINGDIRRKIK